MPETIYRIKRLRIGAIYSGGRSLGDVEILELRIAPGALPSLGELLVDVNASGGRQIISATLGGGLALRALESGDPVELVMSGLSHRLTVHHLDNGSQVGRVELRLRSPLFEEWS